MASAFVIGQRIKSLREKLNISRDDFCNKAGITLSSLSMYENGQRIPRDEVKVRIARLLGVSIESLFFAE